MVWLTDLYEILLALNYLAVDRPLNSSNQWINYEIFYAAYAGELVDKFKNSADLALFFN